MAVVETSRFHKGMKIETEGAIWEIVEYKHSKMAQRSPIVTARLKNIATGAVREMKFRAGDTFNVPDIQKRTMQYLYTCLLYTSPSPRDRTRSRMPSSA